MSGTSKYPEQYYSESRKDHVDIEDLATPHLANAWRKLGGTDMEADHLTLRAFIWDELVERGCTYDAESGKWTFPAKEPA